MIVAIIPIRKNISYYLPYRNCKASHALKSLYLHDISWLSYINEVYHLNISYYYQLRYNEVNNDESIMKNSTNNK